MEKSEERKNRRIVKGTTKRTFIMNVLAQRRNAMMMKEAMTKLHRGISVRKTCTTHLSHRGKRWRRCT